MTITRAAKRAGRRRMTRAKKRPPDLVSLLFVQCVASLRKHPFLLALRRLGRFASPAAKSEEKRMFSQASVSLFPSRFQTLLVFAFSVEKRKTSTPDN